MDVSSEVIVRRFLGSWSDPDAEVLASCLAEDAVWVDGPNGVHNGAAAIVDELMRQLTIPSDPWMEIDTLLADRGTVMVEWHGGLTIGRTPIAAKVMAVFEVDVVEGRIKQMREYFDMKSLTDQMDAGRIRNPD